MGNRREKTTILSTSTDVTGGSFYVGNKTRGSVQIDVTGTITVALGLSVDGTLWETVSIAGVSSWTADTNVDIDFYGKNFIRAVTSSTSGGSAVVTLSA